MEEIQKRIEKARACNDAGYISWVINLDAVESTVAEFRAVHPKVAHRVSIDWDDDSLYRIRFSWEPGTFGRLFRP